MTDAEYARAVSPETPVDLGIVRAVRIFREAGVETFESCEGGEGHCFPDPTIRFYGTRAAGWHALGTALDHDLPVLALRRYWALNDKEPDGPLWEIVFREKLTPGGGSART